MSAGLIRLLSLGCGLLLALPPAWCCYNPLPRGPAPAEPAHASCCHKKEAPKPAPCQPPPVHCPCYDRNTAPPAGPTKITADLSHPVPLALAAADDHRAGPPFDAGPVRLTLSPPLHLLKCLWLC
jgi:hypothetical protein